MTAELVHPMELEAAALGDPELSLAVHGFVAETQSAQERWSRWLAALVAHAGVEEPVDEYDTDDFWPDGFDDVWADADSGWVSPMTGAGLPAVEMDWAALDWSRGRGAA